MRPHLMLEHRGLGAGDGGAVVAVDQQGGGRLLHPLPQADLGAHS